MPKASKILNLPDLLDQLKNVNFPEQDNPYVYRDVSNIPRVASPTTVNDIYLPALPEPRNPILESDNFENNYNRIMGPASRFVNNLINPIDQSTGLPNANVAGPVMVGKAGARNAAKILEDLKTSGVTNSAELAVEFIKRKYPKLASLPDKLQAETGNLNDFLAGRLGGYQPETNTVRIIRQGNQPTKDYINTVTHEVTHGLQENYKKIGDKVFPEGSRYITADIPESLMKDVPLERQKILRNIAMEAYKNQPIEKQATQGGKTGQEAYKKFISQLHPDVKPFDMAEPITLDNVGLVQTILDRDYNRKLDKFENFPEVISALKAGYERKKKEISSFLLKGHPKAHEDWYDPKFGPGKLTIRDIFPAAEDIADQLKTRGYTSIKGHGYPEPKRLTNELEDILNPIRSHLYDRTLERVQSQFPAENIAPKLDFDKLMNFIQNDQRVENLASLKKLPQYYKEMKKAEEAALEAGEKTK